MDPREVLTRTSDLPDVVMRYAAHADGLIDVHLPPWGPGTSDDGSNATAHRAPLVVLLHGGFWRADFDRRHLRPLANALAAEGFVVVSPEYRRLGDHPAGGWPHTMDDVSAAMTALPGLLHGLGILTRGTILVGHSAGGHLALLQADGRQVLDRVVGLAAVSDLRAAARERLGSDATTALLGGTPEEVPDRYAAADPASRLPAAPPCDIVLLHGTEDLQVPVTISRDFASRRPGVTLHELPGVEHFALIDPLSAAWPTVLAAVRGRQAADPSGERLER